MFAGHYFPSGFFAPRYFPPSGAAIIPVDGIVVTDEAFVSPSVANEDLISPSVTGEALATPSVTSEAFS